MSSKRHENCLCISLLHIGNLCQNQQKSWIALRQSYFLSRSEAWASVHPWTSLFLLCSLPRCKICGIHSTVADAASVITLEYRDDSLVERLQEWVGVVGRIHSLDIWMEETQDPADTLVPYLWQGGIWMLHSWTSCCLAACEQSNWWINPTETYVVTQRSTSLPKHRPEAFVLPL